VIFAAGRAECPIGVGNLFLGQVHFKYWILLHLKMILEL
jgi:hypothetical protein